MFDLSDVKNSWKQFLEEEFKKDYAIKLFDNYQCAVKKAKNNDRRIFPGDENIFNAFKFFEIEETKICILGQDPYHGFDIKINQSEAHGLSFSVRDKIRLPPSLKNIYKEIESDVGIKMPKNKGNLTSWAKQGILLLNSSLTVEEDSPNSHKDLGWQKLTDKIIQRLNLNTEQVIFLLWGSFARKKKDLITNEKHLILETVHPSPLSASNGFFGCKHFSKVNAALKQNSKIEINWIVE